MPETRLQRTREAYLEPKIQRSIYLRRLKNEPEVLDDTRVQMKLRTVPLGIKVSPALWPELLDPEWCCRLFGRRWIGVAVSKGNEP